MNALERKDFFHSFFRLYFLIVLQTVVSLSVNLADNVMLGSYSETALSGVAAVNQIQFVYVMIIGALTEGMVIFCSQYWGTRRTEPMKRICATAVRASLLFAVILFFLVSLFPRQAMLLFTNEESIIAEGMSYLSIIRYTYVFFAITQVLLSILRSVENVRIAFYLSIMTFCVNCGINYVLIYGRFGAPELGAKGAAIGTLTARILEVIVLVIFIATREHSLRLKLRDFFKTEGVLTKDYIKITTPMFVVQTLWGLNTAMQTVILGHMTASAIAANSVASTIFLVVKSMSIGAASATSVLIGKAIGIGDMRIVNAYSKTLQKIFVVIGILSAVVLFVIRIPILNLYDLSDTTRAMANTFLLIECVVVLGMAYQMPVNNGLIRGGGSPGFVVKMDLISIWCIVIPLSFFVAFYVKAAPAVVVCCLNADQVFKCVPAYIKVNHGRWVKKLTRSDVA